MVEAAMTQDILKHKTKFFGNFSVREGVSLGISAGVGLWGYFTLFKSIEGDMRMYATALLILPILAVGFIRIFDQPFEKMIGIVIYDNFIVPAKRTYEIKRPEYEKYQKGLPYKNTYDYLMLSKEELNNSIKEEEKQKKQNTKKLSKEEKKQKQLELKQKKAEEKKQQELIKNANKPKKPAKGSKEYIGLK